MIFNLAPRPQPPARTAPWPTVGRSVSPTFPATLIRVPFPLRKIKPVDRQRSFPAFVVAIRVRDRGKSITVEKGVGPEAGYEPASAPIRKHAQAPGTSPGPSRPLFITATICTMYGFVGKLPGLCNIPNPSRPRFCGCVWVISWNPGIAASGSLCIQTQSRRGRCSARRAAAEMMFTRPRRVAAGPGPAGFDYAPRAGPGGGPGDRSRGPPARRVGVGRYSSFQPGRTPCVSHYDPRLQGGLSRCLAAAQLLAARCSSAKQGLFSAVPGRSLLPAAHKPEERDELPTRHPSQRPSGLEETLYSPVYMRQESRGPCHPCSWPQASFRSQHDHRSPARRPTSL